MKTIHYLMILDRSGSMKSVRDETISGVNKQIRDINSLAGQGNVTASLLLFEGNGYGSPPTLIYQFQHVAAGSIPELRWDQFVPGGGTPLNDAIAYGVEQLETQIGDAFTDPGTSALVVIFTDGAENTSQKWKREQVMQMIEELSKPDPDGNQKWTFAFVGAGGIDEVASAAQSYGIAANMVMSYDGTKEGTTEAFNKIGSGVSCYMARTLGGEKVASTEKFFAETTH